MSRGHACLCVRALWAGDEIRRILLWEQPLELSPQAGRSEQAEGRSSWRRFLSELHRNLPQSRTFLFSPLLAGGSSRASASRGLFSPGDWCPLPTSGTHLTGVSRGEKDPGHLPAFVGRTQTQCIAHPRRRKLLPPPQSDQVPHAATHLQSDDEIMHTG